VELETEFRTMRLALVQWLHVFDWNKGGDEWVDVVCKNAKVTLLC
jgi:hypothetical protein